MKRIQIYLKSDKEAEKYFEQLYDTYSYVRCLIAPIGGGTYLFEVKH